MLKLECKRVRFLSELDELSFFDRIGKIKCIKSYEGISAAIFLNISSNKIADSCLRELISLFHRYKIDSSCLRIFLSAKNKTWFMNADKYWHKEIFITKG
jgi:hypothetical protein